MVASADSQPGWIGQSAGNEILCASGHIIDLTSIGVFDVEVSECFAVATAAAVVRFKHHIPGLCQILRPYVSSEVVLSLRASMHPDNRGELRTGFRTGRGKEQAGDLLAVFALPCHAFGHLRCG